MDLEKTIHILNLKEEPSDDIKYNYIVGAILVFISKKIFEQNSSKNERVQYS